MNAQDIIFPQYRKYKNGLSYFKIINPQQFEELQVIGSKLKIRNVSAVQFPEKNFINDLLVNYQEMALEISREEYDAIRSKGEITI